MADTAELPDSTTLAKLLSETLGKSVRAKQMARARPPRDPVTAVYADDQGQRCAALVCPMSVAASLGAALAMIPAATALQAARRGQLTEVLADTVREVFNIAAQLFRPPNAKYRIALTELYVHKEPVPKELATALRKAAARLDVEVDISGYTKGPLSLLTLGV